MICAINTYDESKLNDFMAGKVYLLHLINDLEALVRVLEERDCAWEDLFFNYWWRLEVVYAVAVYKERTQLDEDDHQTITEAIENLSSLVQSRLSASVSDLGVK